MICKRVHYTGRVQGVGFRYTAQLVAEDYTVDGYVRNLANGSVELVAQGEADQVDGFLTALASRMKANIADVTIKDNPIAEYDGFEVRY